MVAAGSRVLDVGCGDGALLQLLADTKDVDGRGIEVVARARQRLRGARAVGDPGRRRPRPRRLSRRGVRLCHPEPHHPGDAAAQDRAREPAAHRPQRHRLVPELRPLAGARAAPVHGPHAGDARTCPRPGTSAPTRTCARSRISPTSCALVDARVERAVAFNASGQRLPIRLRSVHNLMGEKAVFMLRPQRRSRRRVRLGRSLSANARPGLGMARGARLCRITGASPSSLRASTKQCTPPSAGDKSGADALPRGRPSAQRCARSSGGR